MDPDWDVPAHCYEEWYSTTARSEAMELGSAVACAIVCASTIVVLAILLLGG